MPGRLLQFLLGAAVAAGIIYYAATATVHDAISRMPRNDPVDRAMALCAQMQNTQEYRMAPLGGSYRSATDQMCENEKAAAARAAGIAPQR